MRKDMAKLLTEAERYGSSHPSVKWGKKLRYDPDSDYEDEINRVSMSRKNLYNERVAGWYKELSDVLNPLKGYLRKCKGRPWDDVYSELCQNLDRRSVSGIHVFQHVWDFVERYCYLEDGVVYKNTEASWGRLRVDGLYVHPETGILCEQLSPSRHQYWGDKKKKEKIKKQQDINELLEIPLSDSAAYKRINGIWYFTDERRIVHEGITKVAPTWREESKLIPGINPPEYLITWTEQVSIKQQLSKKELRVAGLLNMYRMPAKASRRERKRLFTKV